MRIAHRRLRDLVLVLLDYTSDMTAVRWESKGVRASYLAALRRVHGACGEVRARVYLISFQFFFLHVGSAFLQSIQVFCESP